MQILDIYYTTSEILKSVGMHAYISAASKILSNNDCNVSDQNHINQMKPPITLSNLNSLNHVYKS